MDVKGKFTHLVNTIARASKMVPLEEAVQIPTYALPITIYDEGEQGQAIKGTMTEEFWLNPPFGRPRDIDFNTLKLFENSEWVQICTEVYVDAIANSDYDFVPRREGEEHDDQIEEAREWFEGLPSQQQLDVLLSEMLPDLLWYDAGVIVKSFPAVQYDAEGNLIIKGKDYPCIDMTALDGRSFMIEAFPVGGRWRCFWQYSWLNPGNQPTRFETEEVLYFRMRPSSRGLYGPSRLETIRNVVNYLSDSTEQGSKILENGLFIGGQIDHPDIKSENDLKRKAKEYKMQLQGPKKAGKWLMTGGGVKIQTFPHTQEQMQWLDGQKWYAKLVMAAFKIAPSEIGFCHSEDTEFLTDKGWKLFDDIGEEDLIGGWDRDSGKLMFEKPIKTYHYQYSGKMLHFKGKVTDCCVTPNHRMLIKWSSTDNFEVLPAEDITKRKSPFYVKQSFDWDGIETPIFEMEEHTSEVGINQFCSKTVTFDKKSIDMDDVLRLIGWVASEGNLADGKVTIAQNEKKYVQQIRELCDRLPFKFGEYCYDGSNVVWISSDRQLYNWLQGTKKNLPRFVLDLSQRQLQLLLDTLCDGDGTYWHDNRDHREYYTCEKSLADDVQDNSGNRGQEKWRDLWIVSMSRAAQSWLEQKNIIEEEYDGYVNCFAVPSGFLITRLNGKISIHHNTEDLNRATGIQQGNIHKMRSIRPVMGVIERVLNRGLIWKKWPDISFKFVKAIDLEDKMKQAQIDQIDTTIGKVTINEIRERDGLEKYDDEAFDSPFAEAAKQNEAQKDMMDQQGQGDMFGGWNPFEDDTTEDEDEDYDDGDDGNGTPKLKKAMSVGAVSGDPGFTPIPEVVDGQLVNLKEMEGKGVKEIEQFWSGIKGQLEKELKELYGE